MNLTPLILTVDVEVAIDHDREQQSAIIDTLRTTPGAAHTTVFCTGTAATEFSAPLRRWLRNWDQH